MGPRRRRGAERSGTMRRARRVAGHGIGLRKPHYDEILTTTRRVDWLEITPENFMRFGGRLERLIDAVAERFTVVPHGVSLNVGGPDPLDDEYLDRVRRLCDRLGSPFFSDHVCYSKVAGVELH